MQGSIIDHRVHPQNRKKKQSIAAKAIDSSREMTVHSTLSTTKSNTLVVESHPDENPSSGHRKAEYEDHLTGHMNEARPPALSFPSLPFPSPVYPRLSLSARQPFFIYIYIYIYYL
ncbi:hypothetical protein CDL15_Pgr016594 [Punica granatum]|uniref:Uncharacterized protein n=1 Tax=Punica granatum TaxID=22663 RepID=A0A218XU00_PUNGR|nr:hypothetical protein CDL15_Pgr016594 [Punica granatum]